MFHDKQKDFADHKNDAENEYFYRLVMGKRDVVRTTKHCFIHFNEKVYSIYSDFCSEKLSPVAKNFRFVTFCNFYISLVT